ncbi:hypothetical protein D3C77_59560 [compost metagenome]
MKAHLERFDLFINEQVDWFNTHLSTDFSQQWDDPVWICGKHGSGWLRGNGKNSLNFRIVGRIKGIEKNDVVSDVYIQFMKMMLVLVYRKNNRKMSTTVAVATLIILKRWYHSLVKLTGQNHPMYLTTEVIKHSMDILSAASNPGDPNTANYKGRCVSLQSLVNHQAFTLVSLNYVSDIKYTNKTNLTRKAKEAIALKDQDVLDDSSGSDDDEMITIRGFLNIVTLIQRVESDAEKIALNCLLLLIVTGFRSIEAFNLRHDALIKRPIEDTKIRDRLLAKGLPDYFLGIEYIGVKGAGKRTHWVEPLAVPLVESIFKSVSVLTAPMRSHLLYLRQKSFIDYLPQTVSDLPGEFVELDDIVAYVARSSTEYRGQRGLRDKTSKALANRGVKPKVIHATQGLKGSYLYSKIDLSKLIKSEFKIVDVNVPCTHAWSDNDRKYSVNYEDLLFIHHPGSLLFKRSLILKAVVAPLNNEALNKFLGNLDGGNSIFSKYELMEDDGTPTRLRTHIPRHNINTFLAIAEVSDHLQAMLMGRMDITQNHHYQHLALAERRKSASLSGANKSSTEISAQAPSPYDSTKKPLDIVKNSGLLIYSDHLDLSTNLKKNLHTFDDRDDISEFIKSSFDDDLFKDIAVAFEAINNEEGQQIASDMVTRHAILNPLKFGSCMRNVSLWGCPYRLKCQSAIPCEHFTLTGRMDELPNILLKKQKLEETRVQIENLTQQTPGYQQALNYVNESLANINMLESTYLKKVESNRLVSADSVLSGSKITGEKVKTLAQLFALEYKNSIKEK